MAKGEKISMNPQMALKELGYDTSHPCRGKVLVEINRNKVKTYAFRYSVGNGCVITRWGRLISVYRQAGSGLLIFCLDQPVIKPSTRFMPDPIVVTRFQK